MKYKLLEGNNLFVIIIIVVLIFSLIYTNYISNKIENFVIEDNNSKMKKIKNYSQEFENKIINMQINNKYEITNSLNHIIKNKKLSFIKKVYKKLREIILTTKLPKYLDDDKQEFIDNMDKLLIGKINNNNEFHENNNELQEDNNELDEDNYEKKKL